MKQPKDNEKSHNNPEELKGNLIPGKGELPDWTKLGLSEST